YATRYPKRFEVPVTQIGDGSVTVTFLARSSAKSRCIIACPSHFPTFCVQLPSIVMTAGVPSSLTRNSIVMTASFVPAGAAPNDAIGIDAPDPGPRRWKVWASLDTEPRSVSPVIARVNASSRPPLAPELEGGVANQASPRRVNVVPSTLIVSGGCASPAGMNEMTWCESAPATCKVPATWTELEPPNVTAPTLVASNDRVPAIFDRKAPTTSTRGEGCADRRADGVTDAADVGAALAVGEGTTFDKQC